MKLIATLSKILITQPKNKSDHRRLNKQNVLPEGGTVKFSFNKMMTKRKGIVWQLANIFWVSWSQAKQTRTFIHGRVTAEALTPTGLQYGHRLSTKKSLVYASRR